MKKIKYLFLCIISLSYCLSSCNKNNSAPTYIPLPVIETFNHVMKEFDISQIQDLDNFKEETFVVNSISELPEDNIFGNEEFLDKDIDFSKYSLIIFYDMQFGKIVSMKNRWGYATDMEQYQVAISYEIEKGTDIVDGDVGLVTYVRGAMLVDHIPPQPFVGQWIGIHWIEPK